MASIYTNLGFVVLVSAPRNASPVLPPFPGLSLLHLRLLLHLFLFPFLFPFLSLFLSLFLPLFLLLLLFRSPVPGPSQHLQP